MNHLFRPKQLRTRHPQVFPDGTARWILAAMLLLSGAMLAAAQQMPAWKSGEPIPVGTADRSGPFGVGLTSFPVGYASVTGAKQPDLFAVAGRLSNPTGIFLYPWKAQGANNLPVFGERIQISLPFESTSTIPSKVIEAHGAVWGFFLRSDHLVVSKLDWPKRAFVETERLAFTGLPRNPAAVLALPEPGGKWRFVLSVSDGTGHEPPGPGGRDKDYVPYDGAGIWRGVIPRFDLWEFIPGAPPRQLSKPGEGVLSAPGTLTTARFGDGNAESLISGSWFGNIYAFANTAAGGAALGQRHPAVGEDGILLRHPIAGTYPTAYPRAGANVTDLIAGGEGALYFYRFTGRFTGEGSPIYSKPVPVLQQPAKLFAGTLAVPTIVDWDGDGVLDIVAGNSEGRILFFRNQGSNRTPAMLPGIPLSAGGREIHVQPGYKADIQGPGEARWGYISPNVFDWNGDGLPDILASDSTARHYVYLNEGARQSPKLGHAQMLYLDGLDLHGTWRGRPGVGKLDGKTAYIALDDDDEFHLYWRIDNANVSDGGKLRMEDGAPIRPNFLPAGATGRSKIDLVDWDNDGVMDLLVGTPKHHSIPNPETGLPRALGLPGTMILFLKNVGTNAKPAFRFPVGLQHRGENIYLGHHEIGVSTGPLGPGSGRNVVVSREDGSLYFFQREELQPTGNESAARPQ